MNNDHGLVIAIDGPSGAGKSTVTTLLAQRLGYLQIDTGAMYRAAALLINRAGLDLNDAESVKRFCANLNIQLENESGVQKVIANGCDVTSHIRTPEVSLMTSRISALKPVREALAQAQRLTKRKGGAILEGRDIGTVVFPDADIKFFLFASPEIRGKRRFDELTAKGVQTTLEETVAAIVQRDEQDSKRELSPLKQADDSIAIDSSDMDIDDVVDRMEAIVRAKAAQKEKNK